MVLVLLHGEERMSFVVNQTPRVKLLWAFHLMMRQRNSLQLAVLLLACGVLEWVAFAEDKPKPAKNEIPPIAFPADGKVDFEKHVQPIFVAACFECHSARKIKGKLRLDAKELAMKGGKNGVGIEPGKGKTSYLVKRLRGEGDEDRMPL